MPPKKPTPPPPPAAPGTPGLAPLDPRIADLVQREVKTQMAGLLERLAGQLRADADRPQLSRPLPGVRLNAHTLVLLAAAATAALGGRAVRIRRVTYLNQNTISGWAEMGRVMIHSSHNLSMKRTNE